VNKFCCIMVVIHHDDFFKSEMDAFRDIFIVK
jgi:hypothetical protein